MMIREQVGSAIIHSAAKATSRMKILCAFA
jgi:hypothetical protein